jgi:hypothetical protein
LFLRLVIVIEKRLCYKMEIKLLWLKIERFTVILCTNLIKLLFTCLNKNNIIIESTFDMIGCNKFD